MTGSEYAEYCARKRAEANRRAEAYATGSQTVIVTVDAIINRENTERMAKYERTNPPTYTDISTQ